MGNQVSCCVCPSCGARPQSSLPSFPSGVGTCMSRPAVGRGRVTAAARRRACCLSRTYRHNRGGRHAPSSGGQHEWVDGARPGPAGGSTWLSVSREIRDVAVWPVFARRDIYPVPAGDRQQTPQDPAEIRVHSLTREYNQLALWIHSFYSTYGLVLLRGTFL